MELDYAKPLWKHQEEAINIAKHRDEYGLLWEPGSGKTFASISILRNWCLNENRILSTVVFTLPGVLKQFSDSFHEYSRLGKHVVLLNQKTGLKKRLALNEGLASGSPKIFITNYESLLNKEFHKMLMDADIECLICDESHKLKNSRAKRTKLVTELALKSKKRLILTGTPMTNSPMDLFSQFLILDKGQSFSNNFFVFRARYFYDANSTMPRHIYFPNWKIRPNVEAELYEIMSEVSSRVKIDECLDLPPLIRKPVYVDMSPKQKKAYKELEEDFITYLDDKHCVADLALTKMLRMQQVLSGHLPVQDMDGQNKEVITFDNPRLKELKEQILDLKDQHKIIVWAVFKHNHIEIAEMLESIGVPFATIVGGQTNKFREEEKRRFKEDKDVRVCLASQSAGGTGLDLWESSVSIYYSRNYSWEDDYQSQSRNRRGGSEIHKSILRIDLICPDTYDGIILDALSKKESISKNILDYGDRLK